MKYLSKRMIHEHDIIPYWYGISYLEYHMHRYVCHVIPLNLIVALWYIIRRWVKMGWNAERLYTFEEAREIFEARHKDWQPNGPSVDLTQDVLQKALDRASKTIKENL